MEIYPFLRKKESTLHHPIVNYWLGLYPAAKRQFDFYTPYFTSSHRLALWLLNSGAYMLWIFAMPD